MKFKYSIVVILILIFSFSNQPSIYAQEIDYESDGAISFWGSYEEDNGPEEPKPDDKIIQSTHNQTKLPATGEKQNYVILLIGLILLFVVAYGCIFYWRRREILEIESDGKTH